MVEEVIAGIGPKVRHLRQQANLSLQRLAERSGVSAAAIHKIEHNGMTPTITTLMKIAAALNRPVGYFVEESQETRAAVLTRTSDQRPIFTSKQGLHLGGITGPYGTFFIAGAVATIEPGADSGSDPMEHPGEELIHLLEGSVHFTIDHDCYELAPGDSLHFRTDRPHRWRNPGDKPAKAVWLALRSR